MNKNTLKILAIFLVTVAVVFWVLNYLFLSGKTAQKSKAAGETITVVYDPTSATVDAGKDFTVVAKINPSADVSMRGFRIDFNFDKAKVQAKYIDYKMGEPAAGLGDTSADLAAVNTDGNIHIVSQIAAQTGIVVKAGTPTDIVRMVFTKTGAEGSSIQGAEGVFFTIESTGALSANALTAIPKFDVNGGGAIPSITITTTGTPSGSPTATPTGVTGNVHLKLKMKFQGISKKPADALNKMSVLIKEKKGAEATLTEQTINMTADDTGVWSGTAGVDLTGLTSNKFTVYVKGPHHLQKKICDAAPSESTAGIYKCSDPAISLVTGDNSLDFTKILLLSGDIYGPDKKQDGLVNSIDFAFIKNNLGKTDAAVLAACDINLDGKCDTQDYSLILSALSIKNDEL